MPFYYYLFLFILLIVIIFLIRLYIQRRKSMPIELFAEALKNENSGNYEVALHIYERALKENKKIRFTSSLKDKILEKIKVLHTTIEYEKNVFPPAR